MSVDLDPIFYQEVSSSCFMQDCAPLVLRRGKDTLWNFQGIDGVVKGTVDAISVLVPPHEVASGKA